MKNSIIIFSFLTLLFTSCSTGPQPIALGKDACSFCKMTIADHNFGAELITNKGKIYKFDDTHCLAAFKKESVKNEDVKSVYFVNFLEPHNFIEADKAHFLQSEELHSPMGGNTAVFENEDTLKMTQQKTGGNIIMLADVYNTK